MKKIISIFLLLTLIFVFVGCTNDQDKTTNNTNDNQDQFISNTTVNIAALKGPTAIGMVKLMEDAANNNTKIKYNFNLYATADQVTPLLVQGKLDIAAIPVNLASNIYNKTNGGVQILAVNALNVLYILSKDAELINNAKGASSLESLKGKTIYATGKGATPEYTLREILSLSNIDPDKDVNIIFKSEATEIVSILASDSTSVAMLPQPYATVAQNTIEGLKVIYDLGEVYNNLAKNSENTIVTGCIVVKTEFAKNNPEIISKFLEEYNASTEYVINNVDDAAPLVEKYVSFKTAIAKKAIPYCSIVCITGNSMKQMVNNYLERLSSQNSSAIGGKLPKDDFYYSK